MKKNLKLNVGVKSIIFNKEKKVLLLRRNEDKYKELRGFWDIPGGRIEPGSDLISNLKREIYEETKLSGVTPISLFGAQDIFDHDKKYYHVVRLTYISRVTTNKVILDDENIDYKWVDLEELLKVKNLDKYLKTLIKDKNIMSFIKSIINKTKLKR